MSLSFGGGKGRSNSTSGGWNTTNTQVEIPDFLKQGTANYFDSAFHLLDPGQGGTGSLLGHAWGNARDLGGPNQNMDRAGAATQRLLNFRQAGIDTNRPQFDASQGLDRFMNPFQKDVIDATTQNLERSRDQAITEGQAAATQAGAFGGSRHGVADALTNREFFDSLGATTAGLNAANFGQAQASRQSEVERNLNTAMFNRNMGQQNAQFRLGAANQLGQMGLAGDANNRANLGLMSDMGKDQMDLSDPRYNQLRRLQSLLGFNAGDFLGNATRNDFWQTGTGTNSSHNNNFGFGWNPMSGFGGG